MKRSFPGAKLDIYDIQPGMTVSDVTQILTKIFNSPPQVNQTNLGLQYKGLSVSTQNFTASLYSKNDDPYKTVTVGFGTPATGDAVVDVSAYFSYSDPLSAPTLESVLAELKSKYGGNPTSQFFSPNVVLNIWTFNENGQLTCQKSYCPGGDGWATGYTPGNGSVYAAAVNDGGTVVVSANIQVFPQNQDRVSVMTLNLDDEGNKLLTDKEALNQLQSFAVQQYSKANPQNAPSF